MSLYLKYRPDNFKTLVGQKQVKDILKAEVNQGKINSSYIFFGPRGTGKTSTARIFAKAINCLSDGEKPCNKCVNCKLINEGKTLDYVEIDAASHTQVDKIREEIIDKSVYPPSTLKKKVYVIDEVHMLSRSAFNALLKIMEEPPEYLVFILATTEINKVPETIISRCEVFNFQRISLEDILERLKYICEKENLKYEEDGLKLIAKISDGGLRDAIKYLEQVSIIGEINTENVTKFLGIAPERQIVNFIDVIKTKDLKRSFDYIEKLQKEGIDLGSFIKDILFYLDEHLLEDLENNLKLVNLFDKIYSNTKNFPSIILAYKTIIGEEFLELDGKVDLDKNKNDLKNTKKEEKKIIKKDMVKDFKQDSVDKNNLDNNKKNTDKITKDILLENLKDYPVIRGIIKNFGKIEYTNDGALQIIIISKTNYDILNKEDNFKILSDIFKNLVPGLKFEIKYMSKEDYLNSKLKN